MFYILPWIMGILAISLIGVSIWLSLQKGKTEIYTVDDNLIIGKYLITPGGTPFVTGSETTDNWYKEMEEHTTENTSLSREYVEKNKYKSVLRGAYLVAIDLREADLNGIDLSGADLRWAQLSGANLNYATLCNTKMRAVDLSQANLMNANLSRADLSEANLMGANLCKADLYGAVLSEANLSGAKYDKGTHWPKEWFNPVVR